MSNESEAGLRPDPPRFKIRVFCPDCTYEDYQGCGEGYPWDYETGDGVALFNTREAAQEKADALAAERYGGIWEFEVTEQPGAAAPKKDP